MPDLYSRPPTFGGQQEGIRALKRVASWIPPTGASVGIIETKVSEPILEPSDKRSESGDDDALLTTNQSTVYGTLLWKVTGWLSLAYRSEAVLRTIASQDSSGSGTADETLAFYNFMPGLMAEYQGPAGTRFRFEWYANPDLDHGLKPSRWKTTLRFALRTQRNIVIGGEVRYSPKSEAEASGSRSATELARATTFGLYLYTPVNLSELGKRFAPGSTASPARNGR